MLALGAGLGWSLLSGGGNSNSAVADDDKDAD
jgi:hypothetical protein